MQPLHETTVIEHSVDITDGEAGPTGAPEVVEAEWVEKSETRSNPPVSPPISELSL